MKCQKINLQESQRNRNATAIFFQFNKDQYCIRKVMNIVLLRVVHQTSNFLAAKLHKKRLSMASI